MTTQFVKVAMEAKNDDYSQLQWKIVLQTTIVLTWLSSSTSIIRRKAFQKNPLRLQSMPMYATPL